MSGFKTYSKGTWAVAWSREIICIFYNSVSFSMHGKRILTWNKCVSETRQFPNYTTFSKWFTKQSFAARRAYNRSFLWQEARCLLVYLLQAFLLLISSYIHFWTSALRQATVLLTILKMSKVLLMLLPSFFPSLTAVHLQLSDCQELWNTGNIPDVVNYQETERKQRFYL